MSVNNPLPMLAHPLPDDLKITPGRYCAEEKYDGHRIMFRVQDATLSATWSRTGKDSTRKLDGELALALAHLPNGVYDAELTVADGKHYDVSNLDNRGDLVCIVFDILSLGDLDLCPLQQRIRRSHLEDIFHNLTLSPRVRLSEMRYVDSREQVEQYAREVWKRSGEGLIVKDTTAPYKPGKRPKGAYFKVKLWHSQVAELIGFEPGKGEVVDRGEFAVMVGRIGTDHVRCKTLGDDRLERFKKSNGSEVGKNFLFDYTSRTPDGKFENPVFDRFEDE